MLQNNIEKELDLNSFNGRKEIFQAIKKSNNTFNDKVRLWSIIVSPTIKIISIVEQRDHLHINYLTEEQLKTLYYYNK
ncbi:hypothetical protein [Marivirga sp.]|uniref:hypothetical protein n=1 Tax=Marivirga sp. TaxID=2018662 RepID=UPI003DA703A2